MLVNGLTTHYYYLRDENNQSFGCLCLIVDKENKLYLFGLSICNPKEQFEKARGREIAYSRAYNQDPKYSYSCRMPGAKFFFGLNYFSFANWVPVKARKALDNIHKEMYHE